MLAAIALTAIACDDDTSTEPTTDDQGPSGSLDGSLTPDGAPTLDEGGPDAAVEPDLGPPDASTAERCEPVCARLADCAAETCAGGDALERDQVTGWCAEACAAGPSFLPVAGGTETCNDLVAFGRQTLDPAFAGVCTPDPARPPEHPVCGPFGDRIAACIAESCAPALPVRDRLAGAFAQYCNSAVAEGTLDPMNVQAIAREGTPCDSPTLAMIVRQQIEGEGPDNAGLSAFCAGEGASAEECEAACASIAPCVPPEDENAAVFRNADRCFQVCASSAVQSEAVWGCAAEETACPSVVACFGQGGQGMPPPPGACEAYGARAATCLEATCAPAAEARDAVAGWLAVLCDQLARQGDLPADALGTVGPETSCDSPLIAPVLTYLTTDSPDSPDGGGLVPLCTGMTERTVEACAAACANLAPCIPEESDGAALRDPAICEIYCLGDAPEVPAEGWDCFIAADMGCEAVLTCIGE